MRRRRKVGEGWQELGRLIAALARQDVARSEDAGMRSGGARHTRRQYLAAHPLLDRSSSTLVRCHEPEASTPRGG
jgi:hypothetical protein